MMCPNSQNSTSKLQESDVQHIAHLARLALSKEEIAQASEDLNLIFEHIDRLKSVDTNNVEPLDHPTELMDRWREDDPQSVLSQQQVLAIAPCLKGAYIAVPKVLGGNSS